MNSDYNLGRQFAMSVAKVRPGSQQQLVALFGDLVGSDADMAASFRLLFGNPLYVNLFLSSEVASVAQISSLVSIAEKSLSPALAGRVVSFIRGYFPGVDIASSAGSDDNANALRPSSMVSSSFGAGAGLTDYSSSSQEPATLYADDPPGSGDSFVGYQAQGPAVSPPVVGRKPINLKPLVLAVFVLAMGVAAFKVQAICEPFGLCEKDSSDKPKKSKVDEGSSPEPRSRPAGSSLSPEPVRTSPVAAPIPASQVPARKQSSYIPYPQPSAPSNNAPLRDEPLW